jgi:hypothetical protein
VAPSGNILQHVDPLLGNGRETMPVAWWREHIPAETVSIKEWTVFSARSVPMCYKEENWGNRVSSVRECVKTGLEPGGSLLEPLPGNV